MSSQQTFKALPAEFLDNLFEGFEPGTSLLAELRAFFGDKLAELVSENAQGTSRFGFDADPRIGALHRAYIALNTESGRVRAAATHELLHLRLRAHGFPIAPALQHNP